MAEKNSGMPGWVWGVGILLLIAIAFTGYRMVQSQQQLADVQAALETAKTKAGEEVEELKKKAADLGAELESLKNERGELQSSLETTKQEIGKLKDELKEALAKADNKPSAPAQQ